MSDPVSRALEQERAYHQACRAALSGMVDAAADQVVTGENAFASGADAEVLGHHLRSYAKELRQEPEGPLFFGRLDFAPVAATAPVGATAATADPADGRSRTGQSDTDQGHHAGQSYHIGRRRISEHPSAPPLVVDWRAPVSRAFYRAGPHDPQGVAVRRRFGWAPGSTGAPEDLTGLEDEHLTAGQAGNGPADAAAGSILAGEIERPRVGPMRDIAATIQPEQDELVRSGLGLSLCVQGAPGTGKTAVGLHRAAFLLYTYPQRLRRSGLLILGPNRTFLSYISEVLPALGEGGVRQSTVGEEIARHLGTRGPERPEGEAAAAVKHDARMAEVLHRALYGRVAAPVEALSVPEGTYRWRVDLATLERIVAEVRAEAPPYAVGRERVRSRTAREIQLQAERRSGPRPARWLHTIARSRAMTAYLDTVWPRTAPAEVLGEVLADPGRWGAGILTAAEQDAIRRRPRPKRASPAEGWAAADVVLLDEVAGLIEHPETYGHVVIDEAQDLSPMECRAIGRRAPFGSVTVLGDLAQGTTPWAARSWPALLAHLGKPDAALAPLTVGFRVPEQVVEVANRLLGALDVDVPPAHSLRRDGTLRTRQVADLAAGVLAAVREGLDREGSLGVITDGADTGPLRAALEAGGIAVAAPEDVADPGAARVTVLAASAANGLEYDQVVLAEPARIAKAEARGLHRLYVALTRAVSGLDIVHTEALPPELTRPRPGGR